MQMRFTQSLTAHQASRHIPINIKYKPLYPHPTSSRKK